MRDACITVTINFPALDNLVSYLNNVQQGQIDSLTAKVVSLTAKLQKSSTGLQGSVDTVSK